MIHIVMDTNILINALFHNDGHAQRLLAAINNDRVKLCISEPIAIEYLDIVMLHASLAGLTLDQAKKPLRKLIKTIIKGIYVSPGTDLKIVVSDPGDNKFFDCAYEADVTIIVAQDAHLSSQDQVTTCNGRIIKIYSPWQLFREYSSI
jgi:uncharacterized protein